MRPKSSHKSHNGFGWFVCIFRFHISNCTTLPSMSACTKATTSIGHFMRAHSFPSPTSAYLRKMFAIQAVADAADPKTSNGRFKCEIAQRTPYDWQRRNRFFWCAASSHWRFITRRQFVYSKCAQFSRIACVCVCVWRICLECFVICSNNNTNDDNNYSFGVSACFRFFGAPFLSEWTKETLWMCETVDFPPAKCVPAYASHDG